MEEARKKALNGVVVGMAALTGDSTPRPRYDIDVMIKYHPDIFNLFLQALAKVQNDSGPLGWFSIAGIHGLPSVPWDNVQKTVVEGWSGYCAHGVLAFPTWHRPYLALIEQSLYLKMIDIANTYDAAHRQKYLDAAKAFRLPYFDYFRPRGGAVHFPGVVEDEKMTDFAYDFTLPSVFNEERVNILEAPADTPTPINNPLYSFQFKGKSDHFQGADMKTFAARWNPDQTVRHPKDLSSMQPNTKVMSDTLNSGREARCSYSLDLLNSKPYMETWQVTTDNKLAQGQLFNVKLTKGIPFVDRQGTQRVQGSGSIEDLHNKFHVLIGGRGVMGNPLVAAFDPIFFIHHCNIDRYWALWQYLHPDKWFPKVTSGSKAESEKSLYPFYKERTGPGAGTFYDSEATKSTETLGYTYDDFEGFTGDATAFWQRYKKNYIWQIRLPDNPDFNKIPDGMKPIVFHETPFYTKLVHNVSHRVAQQAPLLRESVPIAVAPAPDSVPVEKKFNREWYVDTSVKRQAANGTFTIYFFIVPQGQISNDASTYMTSPYLAGVNYIFSAPREFCDNCGQQDDVGQLASDTHPITPLLLDYLNRTDNHLDSLEPVHVKPFLVNNLRWRVVYHDTEDQDPRNVPDLKVHVSAKRYTNEDDVEYEDHPEIVDQIIQNASGAASARVSS